jgi:hypothetical protein
MREKHHFLIGVILAGFLVTPSMSFAAGGLNEDFEAYTIGSNLDGNGPWTGGSDAVKISTAQAHGGTKAAVQNVTNREVTASVTEAATGDQTFWLYYQNAITVRLKKGGTQAYQILFDGGDIYTQTGEGSFSATGVFTPGQWEQITLEWTGNQVRVKVNGTVAIVYKNWQNGVTGGPDAVVIKTEANSATYLDDFSTTGGAASSSAASSVASSVASSAASSAAASSVASTGSGTTLSGTLLKLGQLDCTTYQPFFNELGDEIAGYCSNYDINIRGEFIDWYMHFKGYVAFAAVTFAFVLVIVLLVFIAIIASIWSVLTRR